MAIQAGDKIPDCTLKTMGDKGPGYCDPGYFFGQESAAICSAWRLYSRLQSDTPARLRGKRGQNQGSWRRHYRLHVGE